MDRINKYFLSIVTVFIIGCFSVVNAQGNFSQNNSYTQNASSNLMQQSQMNSFNQKFQGEVYSQSRINQSNQPQQDFNQTSQTNFTIPSQLSPIEKIFNSDINNPSDANQLELKQIGYDFFSNSMAQGFGKYDGAYKLNIGEKVDVYVWGDSVDMLSLSGSSLLSPLIKSQVDSKGNIFIPGIGIVKAEGRSISEVEKDIQSQANQKFTNAKVRITVADSTEFAVFVYGYVNKPGKISIGNNSSVIEALAAAGGVNKNGSLRNITYKSSGKEQNVDLYKAIFQGKDSNIRLKPNDAIFVNSIGPVIAVKNGVKVTGIYEAASTDSLFNIINYAGGLLPSADKTAINIKTYSQGQRISKDISCGAFKSTKLVNGDILEFRSLYGKAEDFISLEGNVKHPGIFAYKKGMKLSDVLKNKDELQDETFIHQAVIKRISGDGKQVISIPVSLEDFFLGGNNPDLNPKDIIIVYKSTNAKFVEVYGCINKPKQIPYNENLTLKDVMADIQFIESSPPSFSSQESNVHNIAQITSDNVIIPAYDIAVEITNDNKYLNNQTLNNQYFNNKNDNELSIKTIYLYDVLVQNDNIKNIIINSGDKILFRPLRESEIVKTVKVSGYVNKPGVYKFVEGKKLSDMISTAGGLSKDGNLKGIVYQRASLMQTEQEMIDAKNEKDIKLIQGMMANDTNATKDDVASRQQTLNELSNQNINLKNKSMGRISLNIESNNLSRINDTENIEVQDGDEIYIPKLSNHVMVIGEVYNETSFIYKKGAKASYYIKLVGGYTPNARKTKLYKIGTNGRAYKLNLLASNNIEPGDTIVVPRKIRGNDWITPLASTLQAIASVLTSVLIVTKL